MSHDEDDEEIVKGLIIGTKPVFKLDKKAREMYKNKSNDG